MVTNDQRRITIRRESPLVSTKINVGCGNHHDNLVSYAQNRGVTPEVHHQEYNKVQLHLQACACETDFGELLNYRIIDKQDMGIRANKHSLIKTHYRGRE
jgi:hypothetical protein